MGLGHSSFIGIPLSGTASFGRVCHSWIQVPFKVKVNKKCSSKALKTAPVFRDDKSKVGFEVLLMNSTSFFLLNNHILFVLLCMVHTVPLLSGVLLRVSY